jgi:hypothetical protein
MTEKLRATVPIVPAGTPAVESYDAVILHALTGRRGLPGDLPGQIAISPAHGDRRLALRSRPGLAAKRDRARRRTTSSKVLAPNRMVEEEAEAAEERLPKLRRPRP